MRITVLLTAKRATAVASSRAASGPEPTITTCTGSSSSRSAPARSCPRRGRSAPRCRQRKPACLRRSRDTPCARSAPQGAAAPRQPWDCRPAWANPAAACAARPARPAESRRLHRRRGSVEERSRRAVVKAGDHGVGQLDGRTVEVHLAAGKPGIDAGVDGEGVIVERAGHFLRRRDRRRGIGDHVVQRRRLRPRPRQAAGSSVSSANSRADSMRSTRAVSRYAVTAIAFQPV